jgi:hypothetical protein
MEKLAPGAMWLHAAAVKHTSGVCVLIVGSSGVGKSTAALQLVRCGWSYVAEDRVLVDLAQRTAIGTNWPIRLDGSPKDFAVLLDEGFQVVESGWVGVHVTRRACSIRPPAHKLALPPGPSAIGGCVVLQRAAPGLGPLTMGELLVKLWPQRIARADGRDCVSYARLIEAFATIPTATFGTPHPRGMLDRIEPWLVSRSATG